MVEKLSLWYYMYSIFSALGSEYDLFQIFYCNYIVLSTYCILVYTTQVNSAFRVRWLACSDVISQVLFTSEQPKKNKMASHFK